MEQDLTIKFYPEGKAGLTGHSDGTATLWNLKGEELRTFSGHSKKITALAYSPNGRSVLTGSRDGTTKLWNLQNQELQVITGHEKGVFAVAYSPDGQTILTGSEDHTAKLWNLQGEELQTFIGHTAELYGVAYSPDGQFIFTGTEDGTAKLWNLEGEELQTFSGHKGYISAVAYAPEGQSVLTCSKDAPAKLWTLEGSVLQTFSGHDERVSAVAYSPDSQLVLTGSEDGTAKLWNLQGEVLQTFTGHTENVFGVAFSPDGKYVLTGSWDYTARLWSLQGKELQTFFGHEGQILRVAFSHDGQFVLTSSIDGTAKLWNLAGQELQTFRGHQGSVIGVAFSPDSQLILTGSDDGTAKLWMATWPFLNNYVANFTLAELLDTGFELPAQEVERIISTGTEQERLALANYLYQKKAWEKADRIYSQIENYDLKVLVRLCEMAPSLGKDFDVRQFLSLKEPGMVEEAGGYFFSKAKWQTAKQIFELIENPNLYVLVALYEIYTELDLDFDIQRISRSSFQYAGDHFFRKQKWMDAKYFYDRVEDPDDQVWLSRYRIALELGTDFDIQQIPDQYLVDVAGYFYFQGDWEKAKSLYELVEDPNTIVFKSLYQIALRLEQDFDLQQIPQEYLREMGHSFYADDKWEIAQQIYEQVEDPDAEMFVNLYEIALRSGQDFDLQQIPQEYLEEVGSRFYVAKNWEVAKQLYDLIENKDVDVLIALYDIALNTDTDFDTQRFLALDSDEDLKEAGNFFYQNGKYEIAVQLYERMKAPDSKVCFRVYNMSLKQQTEVEAFVQLTHKLDDVEVFIRDLSNVLKDYSFNAEEKLSACQLILQLRGEMTVSDVTSTALEDAGRAYNSTIWNDLMKTGRFAEAEAALRCALDLAPNDIYLRTNLPPALLLQGKYNEAEVLYRELKDQPIADARFELFKHAFLDDFRTFEEAGIIPQAYQTDVERIKVLLNE